MPFPFNLTDFFDVIGLVKFPNKSINICYQKVRRGPFHEDG